MTAKEFALGAAGIAAVGLLMTAKYKLAVAKPVWWVIIIGAVLFVASTPAQAE